MRTRRAGVAAVALVLLACGDPVSAPFADLAGHWSATRYVTTDPETWETVEWFAAGKMTGLTIDVTGAGAATIVVTLPTRATPIVLTGAIVRNGEAVTFRTTNGALDGTVSMADEEMTVSLPSLPLNDEDYGVVMLLKRLTAP